MLYNPPTGGAANDPYVGKNVAAGTQGSKVPPVAIESVQREIVAVITATGLNPTNQDWQQLLRSVRSGVLEAYVDAGAVNAPAIAPAPAHTSLVDGLHVRVRMKFAPTGPTNLAINTLGAPVQRVGGAELIGGEWNAGDVVDLVYNAGRSAFQIAGLTKNDLSIPTQVAYGATSQGGLAKDSSNNFLLSLISNLTADNRTQPVAADVLGLGRAADGAMVSVSAAALASYILSNIKATSTFQQIVANPVIYVRSDGSDSNSGSTNSPTGAKATIAGAIAASVAFNFATTSLTIQVELAGSYAVPNLLPASGPVFLVGDPSGNTVFTVGSTYVGGNYSITNATISNSGGSLLVQTGGTLTLSHVTLATNSGSAIQTGPGGIVIMGAGITFSGSGGNYALYCNGGTFLLGANTLTVTGNPTFQAFAFASVGGLIFINSGCQFSGSANGPRYAISANAVIETAGGGVNFFPGSSAGSYGSGGQYL